MSRVAVLMGGWSAEREVSLVSGRECANALEGLGYEVTRIDVTHDLAALVAALTPKPDVVFNALHGRGGEDGTIQGILETLHVPYTHSGVVASAVAMHKPLAKCVFAAAGLPLAESKTVSRAALVAKDPLPRPFVVKPINEGSSVGVHIVREGDNAWHVAIGRWEHGDEIMVERYVPGREITVAVMGNRALGALEIRPVANAMYDYESKYAPGGSEHIMPAPIHPRRLSGGARYRPARPSRARLPRRQPRRPALRRHGRRARPHGPLGAQHAAGDDADLARPRHRSISRHQLSPSWCAGWWRTPHAIS